MPGLPVAATAKLPTSNSAPTMASAALLQCSPDDHQRRQARHDLAPQPDAHHGQRDTDTADDHHTSAHCGRTPGDCCIGPAQSGGQQGERHTGCQQAEEAMRPIDHRNAGKAQYAQERGQANQARPHRNGRACAQITPGHRGAHQQEHQIRQSVRVHAATCPNAVRRRSSQTTLATAKTSTAARSATGA